ncbi:MAG: hypothetical protein M0Q46_03215 [Endomicrobiales bacterium]|nr:hypothetical protein [Endomicrobiales bacterium]
MAIYKNLSGNSGVVSYEIKQEAIVVEFKDGRYQNYQYDYLSAGRLNIEEMKRLALIGQGLNTYIMNNVRKGYSSKW